MTKIIAIAGWERCGSTIIANALGSAAGVVTVGEINNIWERGFGADRPCGCGRPFSRCEMWHPIAEAAFGAPQRDVARHAELAMRDLGNLWLLKQGLPGAGRGAEDTAAQYAAMLDRLYTAVAQHTDASLIVDSSKTPWHAAVATGLDDFEGFVLHIVRDPRGAAHSHLKQVKYDANEAGGVYMDRHGATKSSLAWVYRNRLTEATWREDPKYMMLRYEDFVADPKGSLHGVMAFVGLPDIAVPFTNEGELDIELSHNVSGNPVRFQRGPVQVRADEAWRTGLSPRTSSMVRALTWPHMRHYGYG